MFGGGGLSVPSQPPPFSPPPRQVDVGTKNVFGQPRLRASLRDLRSPRRTPPKSSIEDDLKRLIIMDGGGESERDGVGWGGGFGMGGGGGFGMGRGREGVGGGVGSEAGGFEGLGRWE